MTGGNGKVGLVAVTVTVVPQTAGPDVACDISSVPQAYVTDNALFLDRDTAYDITFNLNAGPGGVFTFYSAKPFCNQAKHCPPKLPGGSVSGNYQLTNDGSGNGGTSITVHAGAPHARAVTQYRLNFNGGGSWDPIIIHE